MGGGKRFAALESRYGREDPNELRRSDREAGLCKAARRGEEFLRHYMRSRIRTSSSIFERWEITRLYKARIYGVRIPSYEHNRFDFT